MKRIINCLVASLVCLSVVLSCRQDEENSVEPVFEQETESITADPEGGYYEIVYKLENPVDEFEVKASSEQDWISAFTYGDGKVGFDVAANRDGNRREGSVNVTYGNSGFEVPVIQDTVASEDPGVEYDVEIECGELVQSSYWGDQTFYKPHNYFLHFADLPVDEYGRYDAEGSYFKMNLLGPAPENRKDPRLPAGVYTYDPDNTFGEWTFSQEHSSVLVKYVELSYEEATLTVSYEGGVCSMDLVATLSDGQSYHAYYRGDGVFYDSSIEWLDHDVDMDVIDAFSFYIEEMSGARYNANLNIKFIDSPLDDMGYLTPPGNVITFIANVPLSADGKILPGTWNVAEEKTGSEGVVFPGYCTRFYGPMPAGTLIESHDAADNATCGLVESGSVTVTEENDVYTFIYDFTTQQGQRVTGTYTGPVVVDNFPQPSDDLTLSRDYELYLPADKIQAQATYYSTENGSNWVLDIRQMNESYKFIGDQLKIDMYCTGTTFEEGPTPGTYTVSSGKENGTISKGSFKPTFHLPSCYVGRDDESNIIQGAAVADGELTLVKNDDGTYTVTFDFLDAQEEPKRFYGSWTGTFEMVQF